MKTSIIPRLSTTLALIALVAVLGTTAQATVNTKFAPTGNLITGRSYQTATLLGSGKVLIAGGVDTNSAPVGRSELYVRSIGGFTVSGNMVTPRSRHTATRLYNGNVLIVGGLDANNNPLGSAELYNASTGQFVASHGSLANPRYNHTAVLLPDGSGKVLIISGIGNSGALASVEIYDSVHDRFTPGLPLNTGRYFGTSTPITTHGSRKVLVAGGFDSNGNVLASAELYDPATGQWTYTGSLQQARFEDDDSVLATGGVLITGGFDSTGTPLASAEVYNPDTGVFLTTDTLDIPRAAHTSTLLSTGKVLIAGGVGAGTPTYPVQAEIYKSEGNRRHFAQGEFDTTGKMITGRVFGTATLMANGQVLFTGGLGNSGLSINKCEIFQSWAAEGGDDDDDCGD